MMQSVPRFKPCIALTRLSGTSSSSVHFGHMLYLLAFALVSSALELLLLTCMEKGGFVPRVHKATQSLTRYLFRRGLRRFFLALMMN